LLSFGGRADRACDGVALGDDLVEEVRGNEAVCACEEGFGHRVVEVGSLSWEEVRSRVNYLDCLACR
jgi:hypothetical protein